MADKYEDAIAKFDRALFKGLDPVYEVKGGSYIVEHEPSPTVDGMMRAAEEAADKSRFVGRRV